MDATFHLIRGIFFCKATKAQNFSFYHLVLEQKRRGIFANVFPALHHKWITELEMHKHLYNFLGNMMFPYKLMGLDHSSMHESMNTLWLGQDLK